MTPDSRDPVPDGAPSDDMVPRHLAPDAFDPGSMSTASLSLSKAVWFRRPWFLATIGIIVVIAISVVTDLPHPVTKAQDTSQQNGVIKLINSDTPPCVFALNQSFTFYRQALAHTLTPSQLPTVKNYLLENQTACSFASGPIYDMTNNIQPIDTPPGKKIDAALQSTVKWITYDAVGAIVDIRRYFAGSVRQANVTSLSTYENALASDRAAEIADVAAASQMLGTTLTPINIPVVPRLPGT
jgi:hypothetical protein